MVSRTRQRTADLGPPELVSTERQRLPRRGAPAARRIGPRADRHAVYVQYARPLVRRRGDRAPRAAVPAPRRARRHRAWPCSRGLMLARRAMAPIAQLTATAREIERTRDPAQRIPAVEADDEVAELARTLDEMLAGAGRLARGDRGDARAPARVRRRRLARAAHAADQRAGQPGAARPTTSTASSARRRARRCAPPSGCAAWSPTCCCSRAPTPPRRLRTSPPTSARSSSRPPPSSAPSPASTTLSSTRSRAVVDGARDELHRLALNLMENAVRHTPAGTNVRAAVERVDGEVRLIVEDDGPGIPAELRDRVFERFVRGGGRPRRLVRPRPVDRPRRGRVPRRAGRAGHAHDQRRRAAGRDSRHALHGDAAGGQHVTAGVASSPTGATRPVAWSCVPAVNTRTMPSRMCPPLRIVQIAR